MIQLEVWGAYALFSRPELKVERVSYNVPTPSAARGIVESVYYHPGLRWYIDRIHVLNPIRFVSIRRNEVTDKISGRNVRQAAQGGGQPLYLVSSQKIVQRSSLLLQDVHYVIEAHFEMTDKAAPSDNPGKFQDIVTRRMERGQGGPIPTIDETRDLGLMLYDFDYSDPAAITPTYFRARLEHGVLNTQNCEVFR